MNKLFCASCGFKILYEVSKPKFCSSCGEGVGSISSSSKKGAETESELNIDIDKLKGDISIEKPSGGTSLKEVWAASPPSEGGDFSRPPSNDPEGQDLLDKTVEDCSSSRMQDINE